MTVGKSECDAVVIIGALVVFALPLTLLVPNFSIWDVIPKVKVSRYHAISIQCTWCHLNGTMLSALTVLCCLYLELRKRRLDDLVGDVLAANEATNVTLETETKRQATALKTCVKLLDASAEHYENLVLLRDDLRRRDKPRINFPPAIEESLHDI